jgi:cyclic pyranopterin phosphate synthase
MKLSHVDDKGIKMIEIAHKRDMRRRAKASGRIRLRNSTIEAIKSGEVEKGNVLTTAKIAAIQAVKRTPGLIPLCHTIPITGVDINFEFEGNEIKVVVEVRSIGKTGVEMEALTGVAVALLTIWDMVKALEKDKRGQYPVIEIGDIWVLEKVKEDLK